MLAFNVVAVWPRHAKLPLLRAEMDVQCTLEEMGSAASAITPSPKVAVMCLSDTASTMSQRAFGTHCDITGCQGGQDRLGCHSMACAGQVPPAHFYLGHLQLFHREASPSCRGTNCEKMNRAGLLLLLPPGHRAVPGAVHAVATSC